MNKSLISKQSKFQRVVHVTSVHPHTDNRIHYRECVSLAAAGFNVSLVAVESKIIGPNSLVTLHTIPARKRIQRMVLSSAQAILLALKTKAKIIHLHDPELLPYIPLLRILGKKVVYDAHEDLPNQVLNKPYLSRTASRFATVFVQILLQITRIANLNITATEAIAKNLPAKNSVVVHNYPPLRPEEELVSNSDICERESRIIYVGGISPIRGSRVMIDALAEKVMPNAWRMTLAGSISPSDLADLESREGWKKIDYHGQVGPVRARELILESRVGLLLFADTAAHREALPTKMFEYFAAGVPVIASDFPLWSGLIHENNCGILVNSNSSLEVALAIKRYADNPQLLVEHSRNARNLAVNKFNWTPEGENLVFAYKRLS